MDGTYDSHDGPAGLTGLPPSPHSNPGPFQIAPSLARYTTDPWVATVVASLGDYEAGRIERATASWEGSITWQVRSDARLSMTGPQAILDYHADLLRRTGGTYRQDVVSFEASGGPVVAVHLRTTASRAGRSLDIPTMLVLELARGRIRRVTEVHGDPAAWRSFWA